MNAPTRHRRPSTSTVITIACIALSTVAPFAAFADPPTARTPRTLESRVSLADLDLSTAKGVREAHKRLKRTAENLCRQLENSASATFYWTHAACVRETFANAIHKLDVPAMAARDQPGGKP